MPKYNDTELKAWNNSNKPFTLTNREDFINILSNIEHKQQAEARTMVILLWLSASRPNEILNLKRSDVSFSNNKLTITFPASKGSNSKTFTLPLTDKLIQETWKYIQKKWDWEYLFAHFRSNRTKNYTIKYKIVTNKVTGLKERTSIRYDKVYQVQADNLRYWFKKWNLRTPYYYRHNRMTIIANQKDINLEDLRQFKGAKKYDSIFPYLHITEEAQKKMSKLALK
jgi:integrase